MLKGNALFVLKFFLYPSEGKKVKDGTCILRVLLKKKKICKECNIR